MAKDKLFFMKLAEVHPRFKTPAAAIIGLGVWSAVLVCAGELGSFSALIGGVGFICWVFFGLRAAAVFLFLLATAGPPAPPSLSAFSWAPLPFFLVPPPSPPHATC